VPVHPDISKDTFGPWFNKTLIHLMKGDNFVKNLDHLTGDARRSCERLADELPSSSEPNWRVMDPFVAVYNMVYQLTMRTVGCREIAEDPQMLAKSLSLFESLDKMKSTLRFFFPWLPTINHLRRMYAGIQLHILFSKIADERRKTGRKENDAFQYLIDSNTDNTMILQVGRFPRMLC
jgi:cytochrome P450